MKEGKYVGAGLKDAAECLLMPSMCRAFGRTFSTFLGPREREGVDDRHIGAPHPPQKSVKEDGWPAFIALGDYPRPAARLAEA